MRLHLRIRAIRLKSNFKQIYVVEKINIPLKSYQLIEAGRRKISAERLVLLARLYQVTIDEIIHFDLHTNEFPSSSDQELAEENKLLQQKVTTLVKEKNDLHLSNTDYLRQIDLLQKMVNYAITTP